MQGIESLIPLILIFGIMYFFLIRPQQQKMKEHQAMVAALRRGDQVVTQGGIVAKVTKVKDEDGEMHPDYPMVIVVSLGKNGRRDSGAEGEESDDIVTSPLRITWSDGELQ